MWRRFLRHWLTTHWQLRRCFGAGVLDAIEAAIADSERRHAAEVRFVVEAALPVSAVLAGITARTRALELFSQLRVWDTAQNNGVLVHVLFADRAIEIIADRGYNGRVSPAQWQEICSELEQRFRAGEFAAGAAAAIARITALIAPLFPAVGTDVNELPDRPTLL